MDSKRAALLRKHVQDAGELCEITAEDLVSLVAVTKFDDPGCRKSADVFLKLAAETGAIQKVNVNLPTVHVKAMLALLPSASPSQAAEEAKKK